MQSVIKTAQGEEYVIGEDYVNFATMLKDSNVKDLLFENGLVDQYQAYCLNKVKELHEVETTDPIFNVTKEAMELRWWKMEANTWQLIKLLLELRFQAEDLMEDSPTADENASDSALVENFNDRAFEEVKAVLSWLEETTPGEFHPVEVRRGYWMHTVKHINDTRRAGRRTPNDDTVTEADPDAPTRQHKRLKADDADYESTLHRTAFEYIRRGKMRDAMDLYQQCDQPWRAASLRGGFLWNDPEREGAGIKEGNQNRDLWKAVCFQIASNESFDPYERAIHAILAGDVPNAAQVCKHWEDHLWMHYRALQDGMVDQRLRSVPLPNEPADKVQIDGPMEPLEPSAIFEHLEKSDNQHLRRASQEPFHVVQKSIILNTLNRFLSHFRSQLSNPKGADTISAALSPHFLRFVTHFIILLRDLSEPVPSEDADFIIEKYVEMLTEAHKNDLIAQYASYLPSGTQVERYALFLQNVLEDPEPLKYLELAASSGLDCQRVAQAAFHRALLQGVLKEPVVTSSPVDLAIAELNDGPTKTEERQIMALGWLLWEPAMKEHALFCSNLLIRRFLALGRINSAIRVREFLQRWFGTPKYSDQLVRIEWLYGTLPSGSPYDHPTEVEEAAREHLHYSSFFDAIQLHAQWLSLWYSKPPSQMHDIEGYSSVPYRKWMHDMKAITATVQESFRNFLDLGWLVPEHEEASASEGTKTEELEVTEAEGEHWEKLELEQTVPESNNELQSAALKTGDRQRQRELASLRDIYVPLIVNYYYQVLSETRKLIPVNLQETMKLVWQVEDQTSDLHEHFKRAGKLEPFLEKVRQSGIRYE
ncbi:hypothetical protein SpCBS45565_g07632 [Spizellomyces sp. 'palustris']|nr:hypothetical protein SpCBS45565_g07632 [Spizellomyces sp. 'palustris']